MSLSLLFCCCKKTLTKIKLEGKSFLKLNSKGQFITAGNQHRNLQQNHGDLLSTPCSAYITFLYNPVLPPVQG